MRAFSLQELCPPLSASLHGSDASIIGVSTDSRSIRPGDLFVALSGDRFDGHNYLEQVAGSGAAAALVSRQSEVAMNQLLVEDTRVALGQLGAYNRGLFCGSSVGITGSCGKTSVKNLLASILGLRAPTLATPGNFNNEIGLPVTLLQLRPEHQFAVLEMGAGRAGDIRYLCDLAQPHVRILLNAMPAHLEGFGSVDEVASAKGEILQSNEGDISVVICADSEYAPLWREMAGDARRLEFGIAEAADVRAWEISGDTSGSSFRLQLGGENYPVRLQLPGQHNVLNALAAAAAASLLDIEPAIIVEGLQRAQPVDGRLKPVAARTGAALIDDAYNANPGSVRAAIDLLATQSEQRSILVLGAMAELGPESAALHREVGEYAAARHLAELWVVDGPAAAAAEGFGKNARLFADRAELIEALLHGTGTGDLVLVKGSRSAGMDTVVNALRDGTEEVN